MALTHLVVSAEDIHEGTPPSPLLTFCLIGGLLINAWQLIAKSSRVEAKSSRVEEYARRVAEVVCCLCVVEL